MPQSIVVIVKPDGFKRGLGGEIRRRFEDALGTSPRLDRIVSVDLKNRFARHYNEHRCKPHFNDLVKAMSEHGPVRAMMFRAKGAVSKGRAVMQKIRDQYAEDFRNNTVHCSSSEEDGYCEVTVWFE